MGYALIWYGSIIVTIRAHQGRGGEIRRTMVESLAANSDAGTAAEMARRRPAPHRHANWRL